MSEPEEVTPGELAALLASGDPLQLVDVRETWEVELAAIPGAMVLPLGRLPELVDALDPDVPIEETIGGFKGLTELIVSSYQAASGAGQSGIDTLRDQITKVAGTSLGTQPGDVRRAVGDFGPFPAPLALNVVPWAGSLKDDGWSSEELKVRNESRKILGLPDLRVTATCVRVPVITTHSLTVHARFENEVTVERAHEILGSAPGVVVCDNPAAGEFPTPADVVGTDPTWVGRVRRSLDDPHALELLVCGDNLRKGAALNTAQIAELIAAELTEG